MDGVHDGRPNSLNSPVKSLEPESQLSIERYQLRKEGGGNGEYHGGIGIERSIRLETDAWRWRPW